MLATLPGLGMGTLWDNSETDYGEVAREILLYHDWIVMHSNGQPWFTQPPLYFWLGAIFAKLLGVSTFALRLPSALATIAMGALLGAALARSLGERIGTYAAVILSTCLMQAVIGRLAIMDALLDLAVMATILWWSRALEPQSEGWFLLGWLAAAIGFLAKGPVAPVVALLVVVPYAIWNRRLERTALPSLRSWLLGLAIFSAVVAPWIAALLVRVGPHAFAVLIGHYTIGRYTGVIQNQAGPLWYYLPVVILGFFPWIAFLPGACAYAIRALKTADAQAARALRLAIVWAVLPLLFFSFARTKLPNYIALEFPAFAIVVALYFDDVVRRGARRSVAIAVGAVPVAIGLVAFGVWLFVQNNRIASDASALSRDLLGMGAVIAFGSLVTLAFLVRVRWTRYAPYPLAFATVVAIDLLALVALPAAESFKPVPVLAARIQELRRSGDVVAIQGLSGGNALLFYTQPPVAQLLEPGEKKARAAAGDSYAFICSAPRAWIVTSSHRPAPDPTYGRRRRIIARVDHAMLYLYDGPPCRK